jgi:hypothetical protein
MTPTLRGLTTVQLHRIIAIKIRVEKLQSRIESIAGGSAVPTPSAGEVVAPTKRKYHMTAAHRRKVIRALARARRIRWAKASKPSKKKDRRSSPAVRAKLSAAARARWAKAKAAGKKML